MQLADRGLDPIEAIESARLLSVVRQWPATLPQGQKPDSILQQLAFVKLRNPSIFQSNVESRSRLRLDGRAEQRPVLSGNLS